MQRTLIPVTNFRPERSSQIRAIGYSIHDKELHIEFHPSKDQLRSIYAYMNVTPEILEQFLRFPSIGSAFIHLIKKQAEKHPFIRFSPEDILEQRFTYTPVGTFPGWWPLPIGPENAGCRPELVAFQVAAHTGQSFARWYSSWIVLATSTEEAEGLVTAHIGHEVSNGYSVRRVEEFDAMASEPDLSETAQIVGDIDGGHWEGDIRRYRGAITRDLLVSFPEVAEKAAS